MSWIRDIRMAQDFLRLYSDADGLSEADLEGLQFTYRLDDEQAEALRQSFREGRGFVSRNILGREYGCDHYGLGCARLFTDDFIFLVGGSDGELAHRTRTQELIALSRDIGGNAEDRMAHLEALWEHIDGREAVEHGEELRGTVYELAREPSSPDVRARAIRLLGNRVSWTGDIDRDEAMEVMEIYRSALRSGDGRLVEAALDAMTNDSSVWSPTDLPRTMARSDSELSHPRVQRVVRAHQAWRQRLYDEFIGDLRTVAETHSDEGVRGRAREVMNSWAEVLRAEYPGVATRRVPM